MHALPASFPGAVLLPHGQSYAWSPSLVWLHAVSDGLVAAACVTLAVLLLRGDRRTRAGRRLVPCAAAFLLACGAVHAAEIWTIWHPQHQLAGGLKALTALAAIAAVLALSRKAPADAQPAHVALPADGQEERGRAAAEITRLNQLLQRRGDELQALFNVLPVGVGIADDRECRFIRTNESFARMLGVDRTANASMSASSAEAPLTFRVLREELPLEPTDLPMQTCARENRPVLNFEETIVRHDGTRIEVLANAVPIHDADGRVSGCVATFQDVTALKTAAAAHARHTAIVASSQDAIVGKTLDGVVTEWNAAAEKIFGYSAVEMIGQPVTRLLPPDRHAEESAALARASRGEAAAPFETIRLHKDGSRIDTSVVMSPIRATSGRIVGVSVSVRDITARKLAEAQQKDIDRKLQETQKLESLGVLAGGIAHDFNNLLAGILGNASLARAELTRESEIHLYLQQIDSASRRAAELCRQMLAYSGRSLFLVQQLELNALVREINPLLDVSLGEHCDLHLQLAATLPPVLADAAQLRQVVISLVTNAAEAIGSRPGVITVATGVIHLSRETLSTLTHEYGLAPGEHVFLAVSDNGSGMDAATLARIFEPFFSTKFAGRGLGLAAVLGIVRGHKGGIRVHSAAERGTTVNVYLPLAATATPPEPRG